MKIKLRHIKKIAFFNMPNRGETKMRKMGTISLSLGLIYYGVWLALQNINPDVAKEMFKWWPVIFVILGIEILLNARRNSEGIRNRFNIGVIFIILIFFFTNVYYGTHNFIEEGLSDLSNGVSQINFDDDTKSIEASKVINVDNKKFRFISNNGDLNIKKSSDNNVELQLTVKVRDDVKENKYEIKDKNEDGIDTVSVNEDYVKGVQGTIYVPEGIYTNLILDNCNISSDDDLQNNTLDINSKNSKFQLQDLAAVNIQTNNSDININDINDVKINGNNMKNNLSGNIQNVDISMDNGVVDINNNNFKSIKIKGDNSVVKLDTKEQNIGASLSCDMGVVQFNDEKSTHGTLTKSTGTGVNDLQVNISMGTIKVNSQE
jgi:formylmethanofuran dehydrogenase subunit D